MMPIELKQILYPTDFSDLALGALDHAKVFAARFESVFHCLHVVDDGYQYWSALGPESIPVGPPPEQLVESAQQRMENFEAKHLGDFNEKAICSVVTGHPFAEIISYARDNKIDLIVMATHGRGAVAHMLLGSTTEKVVRKAPCPVLTIRSKDHVFKMP